MSRRSRRRAAGRRRRATPRRRGARRPGATRRRAILLAGAAALISGMLVSIRRGAEGRRVSEALEELERQEREAEARLANAMRRLDSLISRERVVPAAAELGLRPATDGEVVFLSEPPAPGPGTGGGS